jgi:DNA polymerase-1
LYLTHKNNNNYWVIDIETDPIPATCVWLVVLENPFTRERFVFGPDRLHLFRDWVRDRPEAIFVGHNAISFDIPVVNRLLGCDISLDRVVDTLVLSYLYHPKMPRPLGLTGTRGPHSLEAWGIRLRLPKGDFHDFSGYSEEMLTYCIQDVNITCVLFCRLTERMRKRKFSEKSAEIEHKIRVVVDEQERNGFGFDLAAARDLLARLERRRDELEVPIRELFPATLKEQGTYKYRTKADGSPFAVYLKHVDTYPKITWSDDNVEYTTWDYEEFNIGSPKQRIDKLLGLGWKPQKFTDAGNPQVDEESLLAFASESGQDTVAAIAEWIVVQSRISTVQSWINVCREDGRIHGRVFTCGAGTRRMTHSGPNTANIPKAKEKVPYGIECRRLWTVLDREKRRLVGYDASGLEMRCFAHYLNNPAATKLYIEGDPHQANADLLGIDRDPVKNVFYAFIYGAADPKLGWTGNTSLVNEAEQRKFGKWIRAQLIAKTPGLDELTKLIGYEFANGGTLETIDGGLVHCPAFHAAINYKLQSAGGIVMKQASIFARERIIKKGYDALKVGDIHDEAQFDCELGCADEVGKLLVQSLRDAGEELRFRVPLDGNYSIGLNWAETH